MKKCPTCKKTKSFSCFNKEKGRKDGYASRCRECTNESRRNLATSERNRDNHLKRTYGISLIDYNNMFMQQGGKCAICKRHQSELKSKLHVDHCHLTQKVRSLLCFNCNQALGNVSDSIERLENAIFYLRSFRE